jgi:hypothetical protein
MAGFVFRLVWADGSPAEPPTLKSAVPNWRAGDTIPLARDRMLRVLETRVGEEPPVLVVEEDTAEGAAA